MADTKTDFSTTAQTPVPQESWASPKAAPGSNEPYTVNTPLWCTVLRGLSIFFGFAIIIMAGILIHGKAMDAHAFALVVCLMTWVVAIYALVSEKVPSARGAYNIWAILSLDLFMAIMWLASMGANAAQRAAFRYSVTVEGCYNDGSAISSNHCIVSKKRDLEKRAAVADDGGLAMMAAIAGLSALQMIFFIATLVKNGHTFRLYYQANKTPKSGGPDNATVEMKAQGTPMLDGQQPPQQHAGSPVYGQPPQQQPQPQPQQFPQQPQPPYAQQQQQQFQPQAGYYPQPTPSPGPVSEVSAVSAPSPPPQELVGHNNSNIAPYQLPASPGPYAQYPGAQHQQQQQQPYGGGATAPYQQQPQQSQYPPQPQPPYNNNGQFYQPPAQ